MSCLNLEPDSSLLASLFLREYFMKPSPWRGGGEEDGNYILGLLDYKIFKLNFPPGGS